MRKMSPGLAEMVKNMNDWLRCRSSPDYSAEKSRCQRPVPESSGKFTYSEEEYFFHTIHSDWNNIIRTIRENRDIPADSAPIERPMSNDKKVQRFLQALKFKSNPIEEF